MLLLMMAHTKVESNRLNELMSVLEEVEGKVIIWANYQLSVGEDYTEDN